MPFNLSDYMGPFLDEADEQLGRLSQGLLQLEINPRDVETVQAIFRAAHSLKGAAGSMGFASVAALAHQMESLLEEVRSGRATAAPPMIDLLLRGVDCLKTLVGEIAAESAPHSDAGPLCAEMEGCLAQLSAAAAAPSAPAPGPPASPDLPPELAAQIEALAGHEPVARVRVTIRADSALPEARNFLLASNLEKAGRILWSDPELERLRAGHAGREFTALVAGASEEALEKACNVAEVERVELEPLRPAPAPLQPPPPAAAPEAPPAQAPAAPTPAPSARPAVLAPFRHDTIRVDVRKLDVLMNLVGELVTQRSRLAQLGLDLKQLVQQLRLGRGDGPDPLCAPVKDIQATFQEALEHLSRLSRALQESVVDVRMIPIGSVFSRFPRMVRDLARELGKEVQLEISGQSTELDRSVIEEIGDPLVHLIRNAIDHGVEGPAQRRKAGKPAQARLQLRAFQQGNRIIIEVCDDGRGIELAAVRRKAVESGLLSEDEAARLSPAETLNLIFRPGFSTAGSVTDVSGRGVGLDVVRRNVERLSGSVELESQPGAGTTFRIRLPLTLAIVRALLVLAGETIYALPLATLEEIHLFRVDELQVVRGQEVLHLREGPVPVHPLPGAVPFAQDAQRERFLAVIHAGGRRLGLALDRLLGQQEVVIKPLGRYLKRIPGLAGISVLGDGRVAMVLDLVALLSFHHPTPARTPGPSRIDLA